MNKDNQEVKIFQESFENPVAYTISEFKNLREVMKEEEKFDKMSFSEKVKFYMHEIKMDIGELSAHIGMDEKTLEFLINRAGIRELSIDFIQKLTKALELSEYEIGKLITSH